MSDLYRLVYASKNLLDLPEAEADAAVSQILAASQANNARTEVTGALMFSDGAFAQVLEGPRCGVEETFERIQRDARHGDVTVLECGPVPARSFPNWSMAFIGRSARARALWDGLASRSGFEMDRLDGDAVFTMLHALVTEEEGLGPLQGSAGPSPRESAAHEVSSNEVSSNEVSSNEVSSHPSGARAIEPVLAGFDAGQVRAEMARLCPNASTPQHPLAPGAPAPIPVLDEDPALEVLKAALAQERQRTTDLRAELDELRITLRRERARNESDLRERDLWAERARCLAATLCQEADAVRRAAGPSASRQAA